MSRYRAPIIGPDMLSYLAAGGDQKSLVSCILLIFAKLPEEAQQEILQQIAKHPYKPSRNEMEDAIVTIDGDYGSL